MSGSNDDWIITGEGTVAVHVQLKDGRSPLIMTADSHAELLAKLVKWHQERANELARMMHDLEVSARTMQ
jgi:hypothetical protein